MSLCRCTGVVPDCLTDGQIPMLDLSGDRKDLPMPKELPTWNSDALVDTLKTMVRCLR